LQAKKARSDSSSSLATVSTAGGDEGKNIVSNSVTNEDVKIVDWKLPTFDAETTNGQTLDSIKSSTKKLKDLIVRDPFDDVVSEIGCTPLASYKPKARTIEKYEV
jgi:hypothetical protein